HSQGKQQRNCTRRQQDTAKNFPSFFTLRRPNHTEQRQTSCRTQQQSFIRSAVGKDRSSHPEHHAVTRRRVPPYAQYRAQQQRSSNRGRSASHVTVRPIAKDSESH